MTQSKPLPMSGITVLDFSTLLPGPFATLVLAEAGADVIKIERPGNGDEIRSYQPRLGESSLNFALLNRGKRSVAIDLKAPDAIAALTPLLRDADVVVEQFRPGVMQRLGLDYDAVKAINPAIVYCSITGYGQTGPLALEAGHDLNYQAKTGMLSLSGDDKGHPIVPPVLTADLAGGSYPAVINILLALRTRDQTGEGAWLDIAMTDQLFPLMYWAVGEVNLNGNTPRPGGERVTGGSPRYGIYSTSDGGFVAAAPLEDKFWRNFCDCIALDERYRDDEAQWSATRAEVARIISGHDQAHWRRVFADKDVCTCVVESLPEALSAAHFNERKLFRGSVCATTGEVVPAMQVPVVPQLRRDSDGTVPYPALGEHNSDVLD